MPRSRIVGSYGSPIYDYFSACNIKDTILRGDLLTLVLAIYSSCCLMFYLLGLLEPSSPLYL